MTSTPDRPAHKAAFARRVHRALRLPRSGPVPRVRTPTLILWGRRDHALEPGLAEASLALCDDGRIAWFPEATHWVQHDAAQAVNEALVAFLRD